MTIKIVDRNKGLIDTITTDTTDTDKLSVQLQHQYNLDITSFGVVLITAQSFKGYIYTNTSQYFYFDE